MYSSCKRHPDDHEQSLVDFDLALILTPMLLLGITAGKTAGNALPVMLGYNQRRNASAHAQPGSIASTCHIKFGAAQHLLYAEFTCQSCNAATACTIAIQAG